MAKVSMQTELGVSADQVWELIGGFNALPDWHPAVEKSELKQQGEFRELSLVGGGKIIEKLERLSESERLYSYIITEGPLPVANYKATILVREQDNGNSVVEWSSEFEPVGVPESDAIKTIEGIFQTGLDNLQRMLGQ